MRRATRTNALCLVALTWLAGCALPVRSPKVDAGDLPRPSDVQAALSTRRQALNGLRTLARLRFTDRDGSQSARQALIVERPSSLRLEILSLVGPVFLFATNGESLTALEPSEAKFYRGRATAANLLRYGHVPVPLDELVDVLLATPSIPPNADLRVAANDSGIGATIEATSANSDLRLSWAAPHGLIAAERRDADGEVLWQATYGDYTVIDNLAIAAAIALEIPTTGQRLELNFRDPEVNPTLDPGLFALQIPPNTMIVDLDAEPM